MTLKLSILTACSRFNYCVKVRACVLKVTWLMSPRKGYVSVRKRSPRICSPRSELFSAALFSSATATFPIWASAVKTGGILSPPVFHVFHDAPVWQLYLGHLLSWDHQTCQVCSLQGSRYLQQVWESHILSHETYFLLNFSSSFTLFPPRNSSPWSTDVPIPTCWSDTTTWQVWPLLL